MVSSLSGLLMVSPCNLKKMKAVEPVKFNFVIVIQAVPSVLILKAMKKYFWATALALLIPAIIISCKTRFDTTKSNYTATSSQAASERGKELAFAVCAGCH